MTGQQESTQSMDDNQDYNISPFIRVVIVVTLVIITVTVWSSVLIPQLL